MKSKLDSVGHGLAALGLSALGIGLAASQSGLVGGKTALVIAGLGVIYQAFTGKAIQVAQPAAPVVVPPAAPAAPIPNTTA